MSSRVPPQPTRSAGVLLHVTSLPGPYGVGDLGPDARRWVDLLADAGQRWWQILPLTPPSFDSPYNSLSAFAGNPLLISPEELIVDGLLRAEDRPAPAVPGRVDFARATKTKAALLEKAWDTFRGGKRGKLRAAFERFRDDQSEWLADFTLFMALRDANGGRAWQEWPKTIVRRKKSALRDAARDLKDAVDKHAFFQFLFFAQLKRLRVHANARGVGLIGDMPIFVSPDSADVWARPELFQLDRSGRPKAVAGVPPDQFSKTGQHWGNPLYDWRRMKKDGFGWWVDRLRVALAATDLVRIDHFRGFESYWSIPAGAPTAQSGRWVRSPGKELFEALRREIGDLPVIAEDLGVITPEVEQLRDRFALPGMRVLQFAFDGPDNPHLPHNYVRHCIAYTGTHDNDTTAGWYAKLTKGARDRLHHYAPDAAKDATWAMARLAWSSVADLAIVPLQDLLNLGSVARMNTPGRRSGNWAWRLEDLARCKEPLERLSEMTTLYARTK